MNLYKGKILKLMICILCIIIFEKCDSRLDFNYGTQVSKTVIASKEKNVFLCEYKIENIKIYNKKYKFPISEVWAEKKWSISIDSLGKEFLDINTTSPPMMIFLLNKNDSLNETNYLKKWILSDTDSSAGGVTGGIINLEIQRNIVPDSFLFGVYKLFSPYDYKNKLEHIADFLIKRKYLTQ